MTETWERIDGKQALDIELLNYDNQINFIKSLYLFWERHAEVNRSSSYSHPTENALKDLHRLGTLLLLKNPGVYRAEEVHVVDTSNGKPTFVPPKHDEVPDLVKEMFQHLDNIWDVQDGHEIAAYLLWRINWIHPFPNGNGRTARGFAYSCLCLKSCCYLPGTVTVIDLIKRDRTPLYAALKDADRAYKETGKIDVSNLSNYILGLYFEQLSSAGITWESDDLENPA
ncbi:Fic family protein [Acetobacter indonesiensis]